jgi:hypothetical protein
LRLEDDHAYKKIYDLKVPLNFIQIFAFLATTHPDVRAKTVIIIQMSTNRVIIQMMRFLRTYMSVHHPDSESNRNFIQIFAFLATIHPDEHEPCDHPDEHKP